MRYSLLISPLLSGLLTFWMSQLALCAYDPQLNEVFPRGGMRGETVQVSFRGNRLDEAKSVVFYREGVKLGKIEKTKNNKLEGEFIISPKAGLGEYPFRLVCEDGVTYQRSFWVGMFPSVDEIEPNDKPEQALEIPFGRTLTGVIKREDRDLYRFKAQKGQRISIEVEGIRLGGGFFDPYIALLDTEGKELAQSDDTALFKQDGFISLKAPYDGRYGLVIRESSYQGGNNFHYRVHLGDFPRASSIFPSMVPKGKAVRITASGDAKGSLIHSAKPQDLQGLSGEKVKLWLKDGSAESPSPHLLKLTDLPTHLEKEDNQSLDKAKKGEPFTGPCVINGLLKTGQKNDIHHLKMKKGQALRFRVHARTLGSPLDSVLKIFNKDGKQLAKNDDQGGIDSQLDFKAGEEASFFVSVSDKLNRSGDDYFYSIEIAPKKPVLSAALVAGDRNDTQKRKVICIPQGNHYAVLANITRQNLRCPCDVAVESLPSGISLKTSKIETSANSVLLHFSASKGAPVKGGLHRLAIRDSSEKGKVRGWFTEKIAHVYHNQYGAYHEYEDDRLAIAVIKKAPVTMQLEQAKAPLVKDGSLKLKVKVSREKDFKGSVKVKIPYKPPGINAPNEITIKEDQSEAVFELNANGDAALGNYLICLSAEVNTTKGLVLFSSNLITLKVEEPFVTASIQNGSTVPGQNVMLICQFEHVRPYQGAAKVKLHGLPHGVSCPEMQLASGKKEIKFPLTVAKDAVKGNHNNLFCEVTPLLNGQPVLHRIGRGGTIRINPPSKATAAVKGAAKPQSQLQQLRQE